MSGPVIPGKEFILVACAGGAGVSVSALVAVASGGDTADRGAVGAETRVVLVVEEWREEEAEEVVEQTERQGEAGGLSEKGVMMGKAQKDKNANSLVQVRPVALGVRDRMRIKGVCERQTAGWNRQQEE